ncbi:hypothetical protein G9A89_016303 [Geosiphon pyriformis]|nr:hypothetical protein G9A89_016303 [Geosiphon pyriformis]
MVSMKVKDATTNELLEIKNNPLSLPKSEYVLTFNIFGNIEDDLEEFHEHYQRLALTRKEQEQEELKITAKEIQGFRFTSRINVPVNMTEEEIVDKRQIIFIHQPISIPSYDQYIVTIERKVKNQVQILETEATLCESRKIGLVNLHIPAKNHSHIKISIYNNMGDIIKISENTTIGYLTTEIENQLLDTIPNFPQLCEYVDITSQTTYG